MGQGIPKTRKTADRDRSSKPREAPGGRSGTYGEDWHRQPDGQKHDSIFTFVRRVQANQGNVFERLADLELLYDNYSPVADSWSDEDAERRISNVSENVIASNVDTTYASVAGDPVRARFLTTDADWSTIRRAKKLEIYTDGLAELLNVHAKARLAFKEAGKKGVGLVKVYADAWKRLIAEQALLEDIVVPDEDSRTDGPPKQMHHVQRTYDKDTLAAEFPDHADAIRANASLWSTTDPVYNNRAITTTKITVIESWILPIGVPLKAGAKPGKGGPVYVPGRHTKVIYGTTLLDEPYDKPYHPFAWVAWSVRNGSFYAISGAERIAGIQRAINKRNWQIDRTLDQTAVVTTYVRPADGNLQAKTTRIGNVVVIKGDYPKTDMPPSVHAETYKNRIDMKDSASEEYGNSRLSVQSRVPAGLETGAAVREWSSSSTQRFSDKEQAFQRFVLDIYFLAISVCKDLGSDAPVIVHKRWKDGIAWGDVDMTDVQTQLAPASTLPTDAAGREQTLIEWAQAGVISTDSFRRMIGHPDLERELSLYTSALDVIDDQLEKILEGGYAVPEAFDNLAMAQWRGTQTLNVTRIARGVPEPILEGLRDFVVQAAYLLDQQQQAAAQAAAAGQAGPSGLGAGPAPGGQPTAALAPQAMQLAPGP